MSEKQSGGPFAQFFDNDPDQANRSYRGIRSKLIFYFSHRRTPDPENLADDVIARAWRRYTDGASFEELLQYCYGIAANVVREMQKKPQDNQLTPYDDARDLTAEKVALASENNILVDECLQTLSTQESQVLLDYFNGDRTALAARLGITPNALRIRVSRSLGKIQVELSKNDKIRKPTAEIE